MKYVVVLLLAVAASALPWCGNPGQPCITKRDPEPGPEPEPYCGNPGQPCITKRKAEPEPEPEPEPYCGNPGQPCITKH